jgi:hypothetical protein
LSTIFSIPEGRFLVNDRLASLITTMQREIADDLLADQTDRYRVRRAILLELLHDRGTPVEGPGLRPREHGLFELAGADPRRELETVP